MKEERKEGIAEGKTEEDKQILRAAEFDSRQQ